MCAALFCYARFECYVLYLHPTPLRTTSRSRLYGILKNIDMQP